MKKLMVVMGVVLAAVCANAAAFSWKTKTGQNIYLGNATDRVNAATVYLFDSSVVSQNDVYNKFVAGDAISSLTTISTATTSATGTIAAQNFTTTTAVNTDLSAYFALIVGDNLYISDIQSGTALETGTTALQFSEKTASQLPASAGSYAGAGWYTAAVPEPTSGLLLLLGMAGLALKRKQA